jgi:streptomycin 6-kinase
MFSSFDTDLVRRDSTLPGLATLLNPDTFVARLRPFLPAVELGNASIAYIKYKPRTNCLVSYRLEVAGTEVQIYAKAQRSDAEKKFQKARQNSGVPGSLGAGRIVLEDLAIVVSIFPNDSKLNALPLLANAETQNSLFCELFPENPDLWEGKLQSLRYKPERRYVAQLLAKGEAQAVLRIYTQPGYQAVRDIWQNFESRGRLRFAQHLGSSDVHQILAFEWLSGCLLKEVISNSKLAIAAVATVGAALAELHTQNPQKLPCLTREAEAASLLEVAAGISFVCPHLERPADDLAQQLTAYLINEPPVYRPIHGDFYADQVLLAEDTVAILDLDRAVCGDPSVDLGLFIAHLQRDALRGNLSSSQVESLKDSLLAGYSIATTPPSSAQLELYTAIGLLRLAPEPFRYRQPNWPEQTEALLGLAVDAYRRAKCSSLKKVPLISSTPRRK